MNKRKFIIVALLVIAIVGVIQFKKKKRHVSEVDKIENKKTSNNNFNNDEKKKVPTIKNTDNAKPKMIDLGSKSCVPCKMMEPILEDLKKITVIVLRQSSLI